MVNIIHTPVVASLYFLYRMYSCVLSFGIQGKCAWTLQPLSLAELRAICGSLSANMQEVSSNPVSDSLPEGVVTASAPSTPSLGKSLSSCPIYLSHISSLPWVEGASVHESICTMSCI